MTIRRAEESDHSAWNRYVERSSCSTAYHRIEWKTVIERSFRHPACYLLSEGTDGEINGVLPMVQMKSALFGNFLVSLPYFNYGGLCADDGDTEQTLLEAAVEQARTLRARHVELRQTRLLDGGLQVATSKVTMRLDLPARPDDLWRSFPAKLRSQVQRPVKEGMYARLGKEGGLEDFYAVFSTNMRDLGTPVYSREFFRNILQSFPSSTSICTVCTKDRRPVASALLIGCGDTMEMPWASSLRSQNRLSPNMLLYWSALRIACESGYRVFDFGRSTPGEGTYKFKEQWGARPLQLYWHYWMSRGNSLPELNPRNPRYRAAIAVWKKLPLGITRLIGPAIVKNIP